MYMKMSPQVKRNFFANIKRLEHPSCRWIIWNFCFDEYMICNKIEEKKNDEIVHNSRDISYDTQWMLLPLQW